ESVRFTDFHVAPMCTPTRGQLMTGLDACRNGATSVCAGRSFIRRGIPTMAEIFRAGGYRTGHFGKWHLGDSTPNLPHQRGFEESVYFLGWGTTAMADRWQNDNFDPWYRRNGELRQYKGYCTDIQFDLSMAWMREQRAKKEPFFVYLPTNAAHGPHWVAEKYRKPYEGKGPAAFFGMIANLDENMGRLDAFLKESGLRDDTIVILMNDNGGTAGVKVYNAGMRGQKTTYYEGGHRAGCFVRWPNGKLRAPGDVDALTQVQDILPTLEELCGLDKAKAPKVDGTSLAGLLKGTADTLPDRTLVVQYGQRPVKDDACVMRDKWRLVKGQELYDLRTDPGQAKDVAAQHPDVRAKLQAHYDAWWTEIAKTIDDFTPVSLGDDRENPVTLSAADWANVYCDNMQNLRAGVERNAPWHVRIEKDGEYEIALRRWPKEADAAIAAGVPAFQAVDGGLPAGKALPVAKARLRIGAFDATKPVGPADKEIVFTVPLKGGTRTTMETWLSDASGKELCGAYFAYILRR
ncbi:MAG TPA: arylsulfatase, partial [Planctomycetota bacterium]|nr:arylsulfatase [Planctomycetota bacterium]